MSTRDQQSEFERLLIAHSLKERDLRDAGAYELAAAQLRRLRELAADDPARRESLERREALLASIEEARDLFEETSGPITAAEANDPVFRRLERTAAIVAEQLRKAAERGEATDFATSSANADRSAGRSTDRSPDRREASEELRAERARTPRLVRRATWIAGSLAAAAALMLGAFLALRSGAGAPDLDPNWPGGDVLQSRVAILPVESVRGESGWRLHWDSVPGAVGYDITLFVTDTVGDGQSVDAAGRRERALLVRAPELAARTAWEIDRERLAKLIDSAGSLEALSFRVVARDEMGLVLAQSR